jgi:hypothetical protein
LPYNATLCKEAWEKVFVALNHLSIGVINFWHTKTFGALGRSGNWKLIKTYFHYYTIRKNIFCKAQQDFNFFITVFI